MRCRKNHAVCCAFHALGTPAGTIGCYKPACRHAKSSEVRSSKAFLIFLSKDVTSYPGHSYQTLSAIHRHGVYVMIQRMSDFEQLLTCKRQILEYLKLQGKTNCRVVQMILNASAGQYSDRVFEDLKRWGYVEVGRDAMTQITQTGLKLLEDQGYWEVK